MGIRAVPTTRPPAVLAGTDGGGAAVAGGLPGTIGGGNHAHPIPPASNRWPRDFLETGFVHRILYTGFGFFFVRGTLLAEKFTQ